MITNPPPTPKKRINRFQQCFQYHQGARRDVLCTVWYSNIKDDLKIKCDPFQELLGLRSNSSNQSATTTSANAQAHTHTQTPPTHFTTTHTHTQTPPTLTQKKMVVYRQHVSQLPSVVIPQQQWQSHIAGKPGMREREGGCWSWEMFLISDFQKPTDSEIWFYRCKS